MMASRLQKEGRDQERRDIVTRVDTKGEPMRAKSSKATTKAGLGAALIATVAAMLSASAAHAEKAPVAGAAESGDERPEAGERGRGSGDLQDVGVELAPSIIPAQRRPLAPSRAARGGASLVPPGPPATSAEESSEGEGASRELYGGKILLLDIANFVTAGSHTIPVYLLGGPAVHAFKGNGADAALSAGLRFGAPIAGAYGGAAVGDLDGAIIGFLGGLGGAIMVDALVLGREDSGTSSDSSSSLSPRVAMTSGGVELGVGGRF